MFNRIIIICSFILASTTIAQSQNKEEQLYQYAVKLHEDGKLNDALTIFKNLLKNDSSNINLLQNTSILYSTIGHSLKEGTPNKYNWYTTAEYLAKKAIQQNQMSANAHYAYAMAIGLLSEKAGVKTKINNAKLIKTEAETTIKLDPKIAGAYHILGRWHLVVAGFNSFERGMITMIFGKMPGGSYEDAIANFQTAIKLEPLNAIHYLQIAYTYQEREKKGDKLLAIANLNTAIKIVPRNEDEQITKKECEDLLSKLKTK